MRRFLALVFLLLQSALAQAQDAPACGGTNLLEELRSTDIAAYERVTTEAAAIPNGEAVLWKIERGGVAPSHLLGTAHVTDERVTAGPPGLAELVAGAQVVALEIGELGDRQKMAAAVMGQARRMVLPPGQSLWDLIPDDQEDLIRSHENLPPGAVNGLYGYQPWVVTMMLALPVCEQTREAMGLRSFDEQIATLAADRGVRVIGLETLEEQFAVLAGLDLATQAQVLVETARPGMRLKDQFETLLALYAARKINVVLPLSKIFTTPSPAADTMIAYMETELIGKRNHRMAERAAPLIEAGGAFIAVGALHLPGREGVVELLRQRGYKVTPVN